ncbi:MAG: SusC/RagA family TonB-linked outer membrane protein [Odoribacter sp.]
MEKKSKSPLFTWDKILKKVYLTMKLCCFFILTLTFQSYAEVIAQNNVKATFSNEPLREVLKELKNQTGVYFMYNTKDVDVQTKISAQVNNLQLEEALRVIFKSLPYKYSRVEDYILITPKEANSEEPQPKMKTIRGKVVDKEGTPLPGVSIIIKGSTTGVSTDNEGKFEILINDDPKTILVFTFIGMKKEEIKTDKNDLYVVMENIAQLINEVIVTTGYQNIEKRKLSSSIFTIKGEDVLEGAASSLDNMLQGKIPGMNVMGSTSTPGASTKIRIRGSSTISGNREPLWVVDGFILEDPVPISPEELNSLDNVNLIGNAISSLNPQDIQRIDILKDASSTAIYGVKAANGVIVITTKKGKMGKPTVTYSTNLNINARPEYDGLYRMNSKERIDVSKEIEERGLVFGYEPAHVSYEGALYELNARTISYEQFLAKVQRLETINTDWFDIIYRTSFSHKHNLSISGANERANYYFSGNYSNTPATLRGTGLEQFNGLLKLGINLFSNLKVDLQLRGSLSNKDYLHSSVSPYSYAYNTSRAIPCYNEDGTLAYYNKSQGFENPLQYNIVNELQHSGQRLETEALNFNLNAIWEIIPKLRLSGAMSLNRSSTAQKNWYDEQSYQASLLRNYNYGLELPDNKVWKEEQCQLPYGGALQNTDTRNTAYTVRAQVDYSLELFNSHEVTVVAGVEARSSKYEGLNAIQYGYLPDRGEKFVTIDPLQYPKYSELVKDHPNVITNQLTNVMSYYGTFTYAFRQRYIANFNIRADGSNKFGQDKSNRFLPVWSVSARWNLHEESFLKNIMWLNMFALRGSYGVQGNVSDDQTPNLIVQLGKFDDTSKQYISKLSKLPNPKLRWEKTTSYNVGIDFAFLNNRINGSFDVYRKYGKDQIITKEVSATTGSKSMSLNAGNLENKGYELALNLIPIQSKQITWALNLNGSRNINKVTKSGITTDYSYRDYLMGQAVIPGEALNTFYSYQYDKLDNNGYPTFKNIEETDGITKEDMYAKVFTHSGTRIPDITGGFGTSVRYRNFTIGGFFSYSLGTKIRMNDLYSDNGQKLPQPQQNMNKAFTERWRHPGDENKTDIPVLSNEPLKMSGFNSKRTIEIANNAWQMYNKSDLRVVSGNYLRLKNIYLRYTVAEKICHKIKAKSAHLKFEATNLWLLADKKLKGQDPEQITLGGASTPPTSTYTFGLDITF